MAKLYENVFKARNSLYARTYDTETKESTLETIKFIPKLYIKSRQGQKSSNFKSILTKEPLQELSFKTMKEYRDAQNLYKSSNIQTFGNKSQEQGYIRQEWPRPTECDHEFHTWFFDIETLVDAPDVPKAVSKDDWKPTSHERAAMAKISSIQIYDTKSKEFYIFGLEKEWKNETNFTSPHGKINYWQMSSEENLLKAFLGLLNRRNPTVLSGWNSTGYDIPYITNRIIRVLDGVEDLYYFDTNKREWRFNTEHLNGGYVQQLSPVGLIQHRETETNFGKQDEFTWKGYFLEDYLELYKKYTYTVLTSYSLDTVAGHELGSEKVNHDDFVDFGDFYRNSFDKFILYGIQDVALLIELDKKLMLLGLAKFIAYTCGVNLDDIHGTLKQWNSFMYNRCANENMLLPIESSFPSIDTTLLQHAANMSDLDPERKNTFAKLLADEELQGQRFAGGWTRGTGKFWKWVFSLDYTSLYPSAIMWANIGIDTLIMPQDLPKELLDLRAKYFIYYGKDTEPKDLGKYDYEFIENVLRKPEVVEEIRKVLVKYNVSATPNGMFFKKDRRAIASQVMEDMIVQRKVHKKDMKGFYKKIEALKAKKMKLLEELKNLD